MPVRMRWAGASAAIRRNAASGAQSAALERRVNQLCFCMVLPLCLPASAATATPAATNRAPHTLKILFLGGTTFLGPHGIKYALDRGHEVSTFTRGQTAPGIYKTMFRDVEQLSKSGAARGRAT